MLFQPAALREKLAAVPVVKSGLSLMTGTMVTSALGLLFWILAANLYEPEDFGVSTTAVYTMMMLADVACIGLRTGLVRYLPKAGRATGRTISWGYAMVLGASALTASVFLVGLNLWAPDLVELRNSVLLFIFFVASTAFWALFMLEDAVLVGLRKAPWVPIENTLFGILKIVLLVPFATISPTLGIFWAWTLPVFPIVIGINVLIAGVARRRSIDPTSGMDAAKRAAAEKATAKPGQRSLDGKIDDSGPKKTGSLLRDILAFSLADWLAALARLVALGVIPLMVLAKTDRAQAGYFQASWLIAFTIMALSSNAAYALLAETSYEQSKLHRNSVQAGMLSLGLTVPVMLVGLIGAPYLLLIYGSDYSENSSSVLRILLIAAVPNVIHQIFVGRLRVRGYMAGVVFFETLLSVIVVSLSWALLPRFGIDGVGIAWLVGLVVLAAIAAIAESQWWWASRLDTRLVRRVGSSYRRARSGRPVRGMEKRLDQVVASLGVASGEIQWQFSDDDLQTAIVSTDHGSVEVVFARTDRGVTELDKREAVCDALRTDPTFDGLDVIMARPLANGRTPDGEYRAVLHRPGLPIIDHVRRGSITVEQACRAVIDSVEPIAAAAAPVLVDQEMLDSWIEGPVAHLMSEGRASASKIETLRALLTDGFVGKTVAVGRIQGDLTLDNARATGDPIEVTGFLRWDRSALLPLQIDPAVLVLSSMTLRGSTELGDVVRDLLNDPQPFEEHSAMAFAPKSAVPARAVLLLAWLHLVGHPHQPEQTVSSDVFWLARNAQPVLSHLDAMVGSDR